MKLTSPLSKSIRPMTHADLELVLNWRNSDQIRRCMFNQSVIGWHEHQQWFDKLSEDPKAHLLIFQINEKAEGFVKFYEVSLGVAEWGFYLSPNAPAQSGFSMGNLALNYAFNFVGIECIHAKVLDINIKSINFHKKLGFSFSEQFVDGSRIEKNETLNFYLSKLTWINHLSNLKLSK